MLRKRFPQAARLVFLGLVVGSVMWSVPVLPQDKPATPSDQPAAVPGKPATPSDQPAVAPDKPSPRGPCFADAQRLCPEARTIRQRGQCLESHEADLSQACKDVRAKAQGISTGVKEACAGDVEKLCKDAPPDSSAMARCLKEHEAELSAACKDALPKRRGRAS